MKKTFCKHCGHGFYRRKPASEGKNRCHNCLPTGSLILTTRGTVPIEQISIGDKVYTHKGRWMSVIETYKRQYSGDLLEIHTSLASVFPLTLTPEHPVFTNRLIHPHKDMLQLGSYQWVEARNLTVGSYHNVRNMLVFPRILENIDRETIQTNIPLSPGRHIRKYFLPTAELLSLAGYYLAEGCCLRSSKRGIHGLSLTFGKNLREYFYAVDCGQILVKMGYHPRIEYVYGWHVTVESVELARFIHREFGEHASKKHIPNWVKLLPPEKLQFLFENYIRGDGYIPKDGHVTRASTVSLDLALDLRDIAMKMGYNVSIRDATPKSNRILGRIVNIHTGYSLAFVLREDSNHIRSDKRCVYLHVQNITKKKYEGFVYNLEVEEDHSYSTPYHIVHNCHACLKCGNNHRGEYCR